jgi:hypothetical protein
LCGKRTAIQSFGDLPTDHGRVQMYCENEHCDARETEVIVVDDGTTTTPGRTDVRIMARYGRVTTTRPSWWMEQVGRDWATGTVPSARTVNGKTTCLFCGEQTCTPSRNDVPADTERLRLHCTNPRCSVSEVEVIVTRDGTSWTRNRPDVKALDAIVPRRRRPWRPDRPEIVSLDISTNRPRTPIRWKCASRGRFPGSVDLEVGGTTTHVFTGRRL